MDREELAAWLRLTVTAGVGNGAARRLLACFGMPQAIFAQSAAALQQCVSDAQARALCAVPPIWQALLEKTEGWLSGADPQGPARPSPQGRGHAIRALGNGRSPRTLLETPAPPLLLYLMGPAHLLAQQAFPAGPCLAVVGSRNPSAQGAEN